MRTPHPDNGKTLHQHQHHQYGDWGDVAALAPLLLLACVATAYFAAVLRQPRDGKRHWSGWRTASFAAGVALVAVALAPPMMKWGHHDLRGHMVQHLLIGMLAPLGLVLAAPVTLVLRTLPVGGARRIVSVLRARPVHWLAHPVTALLLNLGGMYLLYLTPLYRATLTNPHLHHFVHFHFLAAGCLFTWSIAGPDPAPRRPGFSTRLVILLIAMAAHAYLSKFMYAHVLPSNVPHSAEEIRAAAKLMYYGGDLSELLLVIALFGTWYRRRGRQSVATERASGSGADSGDAWSPMLPGLGHPG